MVFEMMLLTMMQVHPPLPEVKHRHVVIAHRGDHVSLPENTLAAYASAIKLGVDYIETDLRTTKNNQLVISHDAALKNKLPTFKEILNLCRNKVNIYLDFKDADVAVTYRMILDAGMEKHVVVYANTLSQLRQWNQLAPAIPVMTSVPDNIKLSDFLNEYTIAAVDGSIGQYSDAELQLFRSRNIAVWLDVQQSDEGPAVWSKALNADGMQTDHPAALISYLHQPDIVSDEFYHHPEHILVAAHRAVHNKYPENSLPAVKRAIDAGIDIVELDIRETKDKKLVLMHDERIDRTTNGKGLVSDYTYQQLSAFRLKNSKEHIPSFESALKLAKGKIMIDIDFKAGTESALKETYRLVKAYHMEKQVLFFVYDYKEGADTSLPVMPRVHNPEEVRAVLQMNCFPIIHIDESFYTDSLMKDVRNAGVRIWSNALGKYDDMEEIAPGSGFTEMLKMERVNVIQTNYPEELLGFLKRNGYHR